MNLRSLILSYSLFSFLSLFSRFSFLFSFPFLFSLFSLSYSLFIQLFETLNSHELLSWNTKEKNKKCLNISNMIGLSNHLSAWFFSFFFFFLFLFLFLFSLSFFFLFLFSFIFSHFPHYQTFISSFSLSFSCIFTFLG